MKIEDTEFGSITIDGRRYDHDIVIHDGKILKRKKEISREKHGTSHKLSQEEMGEYLEEVSSGEVETLIVGTGQYGRLSLQDGTKRLLREKDIEAVELKTPEAINRFEGEGGPEGKKLGIFHVTC